MLSRAEVAPSSILRLEQAAVGLLMIVAVVSTLIGTQQGVGATPDSATYASVAENLAGGRGLTTYDGAELTLFPPGLPGLLAVGGVIGLEPAAAARAVNALSLAVIVLLGAILIRRSVASAPLRLAGLGLIAFSPVLFSVSVVLLSEAPFVAVTLVFLVVLERAAVERSSSLAAAAAVLAGAGFLLRYPGLTLIGFGIFVLALQAIRNRDSSGAGRVAIFAGIALLPVAGWLLHNLLEGSLLGSASGSPIEDRARAGQGFVDNLLQVFETVGAWLIPAGGMAALVMVAVVALTMGVANQRAAVSEKRKSRVAFLSSFSLFYLVVVVAGATVTHVDPFDGRLLSPIYVPLVVAVLVVAERVLDSLSGRSLLRWAVAVALVAWLLVPFATWSARVRTSSQGVGFASAQWQDSSLLALLRTTSDGGPVYSNWPDGIYYAGGEQPVHFGPSDSAASRRGFTEAVQCAGRVRFAEYIYRRPMLIGVEDLGPLLHVELIDTVADGSLYEVSAVGGPNGIECVEATDP